MELNDRPAPDLYSLLEDDQLNRIVTKQSVLRDYEASRLTKEEFIRQRGISRSTFYRDLGRRKNGGFRGLVDHRKFRTKRGIRLDDRATEIILEHLVDYPKAPVSAVHTEIEKRFAAGAWGNPPTYDKVRRFVRSIASDVLRQWADGRKARIEEQSLTVRRVVTQVNQLWQTDFSELPIWTFDPAVGPELYKPWIMGTIDCASRVVPGTLVAKTIGAREAVACWKKAMGEASEEISTELAEQISTSRLERTIAIDRLAKALREKNGQLPPAPVPELPKPNALDETITVPATPTPVDGAPSAPQESLGPIPELPKNGASE